MTEKFSALVLHKRLLAVLCAAECISAHAAAADPYARPSEDLYAEPGQTWTKNMMTHSTDLRLLESGLYVIRENADAAPGRPMMYRPGTWTRSEERIVLSFPGAAKPVMELQPMMVNGCRALVPVEAIAERGTGLAMSAYRLEGQDCPHFWDN